MHGGRLVEITGEVGEVRSIKYYLYSMDVLIMLLSKCKA